MPKISGRHQILIGLVLAALMVVTRGQHMLSLVHMPGASVAVFFLAGLYLRPVLAFPLFLLAAVAIDYVAVQYAGVSSFCVTPAYAALILAYGAVWLAGRWYGRRLHMRADTLVPLAASLAVAGVVFELISSGSFYFLSGRFAAPSLAGFAERLAHYLPQSMGALILYVGLAATTHVIIVRRQTAAPTRGKPGYIR